MTDHEALFAQYPDKIFDAAMLALIESGSHGDVAGLDDIPVADAQAWLDQTAWWSDVFERVDQASKK
jgi:hypothetical protein